MTRTASVLVVGVGNEHRGDDALGLEVARALVRRVPSSVKVVEAGDDLTELLDLWQDVDLAIVVDTFRSEGTAGEIVRWAGPALDNLASQGPLSTHGLSLPQALALGRTLEKVPRQLVVYGIRGSDFRIGRPIAAEVARALPEVEQRILTEISNLGRDVHLLEGGR